jgi:dihydrofolate reductase/thymidylate synthase
MSEIVEFSLNIIVAFSKKNFGIGYKNKIPWNIPDDLLHFSKITKNSICVMGRNTWESIPNNKKPLKDRLNILISSRTNILDNITIVHPDNLITSYQEWLKTSNVFIIGGVELYKKFMGIADNIYTTIIEKNFECDVFFPIEHFNKYEIENYSNNKFSKEENCYYSFIKYKKNKKEHGEKIYLNHMKNIMENGDIREKERTGTGTKSLFGGQLRFDISKSVPILTTKFVPFQLTVKELLFFLKGYTDTKILEVEGVNIWKGNTSKEFLQSMNLPYEEGEMGPMYGWLWNFFGAEYKGCPSKYDYTGQGINQLENLVNGLIKDPWSRRHLMTTYSPSYANQSVLFPCHGLTLNYYYSEKNNNKYLSCHVYIRSSDGFLGLPINILSYAILTYIIAKKCNYLPYELIISFGDAHIYKNHYDAVNTQLSKNILPFPILKVNDSIVNKNINEINLSDFELIGYLSNPKILAPMAI